LAVGGIAAHQGVEVDADDDLLGDRHRSRLTESLEGEGGFGDGPAGGPSGGAAQVEEPVGGGLIETEPLTRHLTAGSAGATSRSVLAIGLVGSVVAQDAVAERGDGGPRLGHIIGGGPERDLGGPVTVLSAPTAPFGL